MKGLRYKIALILLRIILPEEKYFDVQMRLLFKPEKRICKYCSTPLPKGTTGFWVNSDGTCTCDECDGVILAAIKKGLSCKLPFEDNSAVCLECEKRLLCEIDKQILYKEAEEELKLTYKEKEWHHE